MKKHDHFCLLALALLLFSACKGRLEQHVPVDVIWEMGANEIEPGCYENTFRITNISRDALHADWKIYFNQLPATVIPQENALLEIEQICATYYRMSPGPGYRALQPGDTLEYTFRCHGNIIKQTNAPEGMYMVRMDKAGQEAGLPQSIDLQVIPYTHEYQWSRKGGNEPPYPYGDRVYEQHRMFDKAVDLMYTDIFPSIKRVDYLKGEPVAIGKEIKLEYDDAFAGEAEYLKEKLQSDFGAVVSDQGKTVIRMGKLNTGRAVNDEFYTINLNENVFDICSTTPHGIFNGVQTVLAFIGNGKGLPCELSPVYIEDYPDLAHRGMMLDVARNFSSKANVLKLIDLLASYKMNVFHIHLSDDEAWRLEIPGLEELTEVGARRGHTLDERTCLYPAYGGGWDPEDKNRTGSGYYTRQDFIDMLQYARERHITVIPEIDLPGHARAAIKAMNARYHTYKDTDPEKAGEYLLADFEDTSEYYSAQAYTDNVINVAMPSTYRFVKKVIDEMANVYSDAGLELRTLHLGGDEVAHGAWAGSPICRRFMQDNRMTEVRELKDYFVQQVLDYMTEKNIRLAGWQEVVLLPDHTVNKRFAQYNILSYCWDTVPEWGSDEIAYQLANAGYPIILSNVSNFYFDLSYNKHQMEPGHYWGGFVNEYAPFSMLPYDVYKSLRYNMRGEKIDINKASTGKLPLKREGRVQIEGVQGQIWAETIRSFDMVESYLFPKLMGLSDRAWNAEPAWAYNEDEEAYNEAMRLYNAKIGEWELPRLQKKKVNFHIPLPGIRIENGRLYANIPLKGAVIRYTTDGAEPSETSPAWTSPVACDASMVKAKAYYLDKESVTTLLLNK